MMTSGIRSIDDSEEPSAQVGEDGAGDQDLQDMKKLNAKAGVDSNNMIKQAKIAALASVGTSPGLKRR